MDRAARWIDDAFESARRRERERQRATMTNGVLRNGHAAGTNGLPGSSAAGQEKHHIRRESSDYEDRPLEMSMVRPRGRSVKEDFAKAAKDGDDDPQEGQIGAGIDGDGDADGERTETGEEDKPWQEGPEEARPQERRDAPQAEQLRRSAWSQDAGSCRGFDGAGGRGIEWRRKESLYASHDRLHTRDILIFLGVIIAVFGRLCKVLLSRPA